jgi:hypothetical protein
MITGTHVLVLQGKNQVNAGIGCQYGGRQRTAGLEGMFPAAGVKRKPPSPRATYVAHRVLRT